MAAEAPLNRLVLAASSVADDLGYVALADLSRVLGSDASWSYRIIGGHMVTAFAARRRLGAELYRETGDVDLGVPPTVVRDARVIEGLTNLGYNKIAGNRFARTMSDVPVIVAGEIMTLLVRRSSTSSFLRTRVGHERTTGSAISSSPPRSPACRRH